MEEGMEKEKVGGKKEKENEDSSACDGNRRFAFLPSSLPPCLIKRQTDEQTNKPATATANSKQQT